MANGFLGTEVEWLAFLQGADGVDGSDGREVEVQKSATHIQWRYVGDAVWVDLVALTDITGPAGADGADGDAADIAGETHAATSKATPDDADELGYLNSAAGFDLVKMTWANLKDVLLAYFNGKFREKLTADRAYYVRADGSDSNNGLTNTSGGAFLTIQKAIDVAAGIDLGIYTLTINVGVGTWTSATMLKTLVGAGKVVIRGINANTTDTVMAGTTACFKGAYVGVYEIQYMTLGASVEGICIDIYGAGAVVRWGDVNFAAAAAHVRCITGAYAEAIGPYTISGGGSAHVSTHETATLRVVGVAVTLIGSPSFTSAFAVSNRVGSLLIAGATFSGAAIGPRYSVDTNSVIYTGAGESFLPGNAAGTKATGGQYV